MSTCDVILAVWNGQNYLPAMLDSLLSQTAGDFNVLVRDDGSTDGSLEILENYKPKFDGRLSIIAGEPTRSATANFAILMRETKADYVLFADQDDVWKPEKVGLTLRSLKEAEAKYGKSTPIYFATDIAVVNKDLEVISPSYWKWKRLKPSMMGKLSQSLICVPIQGMASGINRALLDLANPSLQQCTFGMLNSGEVRLPTPPPTDQIVNPGMLRSYRLILRTSGESSWAAAGKASTINAAPKIRTPSILHLELYTPQP